VFGSTVPVDAETLGVRGCELGDEARSPVVEAVNSERGAAFVAVVQIGR
jgi:hypothetical protein